MNKKPKAKFELPDRDEFIRIYESNSNEEAGLYFGVGSHMIDAWREKLGVARKANKWKDYIDLKLTDRQTSIVMGSLLGDGHLKRIESEKSNSAFTEIHGEKQRDYLKWKYNELLPLSCAFTETTTDGRLRLEDGTVLNDPTTNLVRCNMGTMSHPIFTELEKDWYARDSFGNYILDDNGWRIKVIPQSLKLDELMISVWYMDDGSHNGVSSATFNTQGFTFEECGFLSSELNKFGFKTTINTNRGMPIISLWSSSYLQFMEMVKSNVSLDCMNHKIDLSKYDFDKNSNLGKKINKEEAKQIVDMLLDGVDDKIILLNFPSITWTLLRDIRLGRTWTSITKLKLSKPWQRVLRTDKLSNEKIVEIRNLAASSFTDAEIAKIYNRKPKYIQSIRLGIKRKSAGGILTNKKQNQCETEF